MSLDLIFTQFCYEFILLTAEKIERPFFEFSILVSRIEIWKTLS